MGTNLLPRVFKTLVEEDIKWLESIAPATLERDHIVQILRFSIREYEVRGYDEAMSRAGPHSDARFSKAGPLPQRDQAHQGTTP